jgi:hypothetical protein
MATRKAQKAENGEEGVSEGKKGVAQRGGGDRKEVSKGKDARDPQEKAISEKTSIVRLCTDPAAVGADEKNTASSHVDCLAPRLGSAAV